MRCFFTWKLLVKLVKHFRVELFKGIPYAQPPVGSARWNPPMKLESFDQLNKDEFQHHRWRTDRTGLETNTCTKRTFWKPVTVHEDNFNWVHPICTKPIESSLWRRLFGSQHLSTSRYWAVNSNHDLDSRRRISNWIWYETLYKGHTLG